MRHFFTFGQRYDHEPHPSGLPITGSSYVVFEGGWLATRKQAWAAFGGAWAFQYTEEEFAPQIKKYGLTEVVIPQRKEE